MAPGSTAAKLGKEVLLQGKERDRSWVNTLSYTTQLAILMRLALVAGRQAGMAGLDEFDFALNAMPETLKQILRLEPKVETLARQIAERDRFLFVGGGPNLPTALEAALKMKEATYTAAEAWEVEQIIHGPIFSFDGRYAAFILLPPGPSRLRGLAVLRALRKAGVHVVALGEEGDREAEDSADGWVPLPPVGELLSPIPYIVPLQLLTYQSAVARGINPDPLRTEDPGYGEASALLFER
jgi:glucosamine--fructose-6-phosphate aminotransferase (isomerizing)